MQSTLIKVAAYWQSLTSKQRVGGILLVLSAICAICLAILVVAASLEKGAILGAAFFVLLAGAVSAIASIVAFIGETKAPPSSGEGNAIKESRNKWLAPSAGAAVMLAVFTAFGTMTDLLSFFSPKPAIESSPGIIEETLAETRSAVERTRDMVGGLQLSSNGAPVSVRPILIEECQRIGQKFARLYEGYPTITCDINVYRIPEFDATLADEMSANRAAMQAEFGSDANAIIRDASATVRAHRRIFEDKYFSSTIYHGTTTFQDYFSPIVSVCKKVGQDISIQKCPFY